MKNRFGLLAICIALMVAGCGPSRMVVLERPVAPVYAMPAAPGPGFVWVSGEWVYRRNNYVYRRGHWARQHYGHMYYVPGKWESRGQGWRWVPGHWR